MTHISKKVFFEHQKVEKVFHPKTDEIRTLGLGKWSSLEVPRQGWICISTEDLGEPQLICEMCEKEEIRYVHHMEHPKNPEVLKVGCICAGYMEESTIAAKQREVYLKNRAANRKRWTSRIWKCGLRGNYIVSGKYRITIYHKHSGWWVEIQTLTAAKVHYPTQHFETMDEAKLYAFDYIYPKKVIYSDYSII
jgi:hypothetical protein